MPTDGQSLVVLRLEDFTDLLQKSLSSPRRRAAKGLRAPEDPVQILVNCLQPGTCLMPHRHTGRPETRYVIDGMIALLRFNDQGDVLEFVLADTGTVVTTPAGEWEMMVAMKANTTILDIITGPYNPATHKENAPFAPEENDQEAAQEYLKIIEGWLSSQAHP